MYYACKKHSEHALDVFVDEYEKAPIINIINDEKSTLSTTCSFCESIAAYTITGNRPNEKQRCG